MFIHPLFTENGNRLNWPHLLLFLAFFMCIQVCAATLVENQSLEWDGTERFWNAYIPENLPTRVPLVVLLHGGGQSKDKVIDPQTNPPSRKWIELADEENFIVIVPNGINNTTGSGQGDSQSWNDGRGDNTLLQFKPDDVGFLNALLDWAETNYPIDKNRIYFTGSSNGGFMSYRMAQELSHRIAAVAAFIANKPAVDTSGDPEFPVSVFICNGSGETLYVPWAGGFVVNSPSRGSVLSAPATRDYWVAVNNCNPEPEITNFPDTVPSDNSTVFRQLFTGGDDGTEVAFYTVVDGGHVLPSAAHPYNQFNLNQLGLGIQNRDIEAINQAWDFLSRQTLGVTRPSVKGWMSLDRYPYVWSEDEQGWLYFSPTDAGIWIYSFTYQRWSFLDQVGNRVTPEQQNLD